MTRAQQELLGKIIALEQEFQGQQGTLEPTEQKEQKEQKEQLAQGLAQVGLGGQIRGSAFPNWAHGGPEVDSHGRVYIADEHMKLITGILDDMESRLSAKIDAKLSNLVVTLPAEGVEAIAKAIGNAATNHSMPTHLQGQVSRTTINASDASDDLQANAAFRNRDRNRLEYLEIRYDKLRDALIQIVETFTAMNHLHNWEDRAIGTPIQYLEKFVKWTLQ